MKDEDKKIEAWNKAMKRWLKTKKPTLGQMMGGCPKCGHMCSFDQEEFHCYKCGWDWKDEAVE